MRGLIICLIASTLAGAAAPAYAECFGSDAFSTCYDDSGNAYTVQRFGNQTFMNGSNSRTGSTWSQNSMTMGHTSYHNGVTNGNSWNMTDQRYGGMRSIYGTDSRGNHFNYNCTQMFGCN
jgi:hypothetical protein